MPISNRIVAPVLKQLVPSVVPRANLNHLGSLVVKISWLLLDSEPPEEAKEWAAARYSRVVWGIQPVWIT